MNKKIFNKLLSSTMTASLLLSNFEVLPLLHGGSEKNSDKIKLGMSEENLQLTEQEKAEKKSQMRQEAIDLLEQVKSSLEPITRFHLLDKNDAQALVINLPQSLKLPTKDEQLTDRQLSRITSCLTTFTLYSLDTHKVMKYLEKIKNFVVKNLSQKKPNIHLTIDDKHTLIDDLLETAQTQYESHKNYFDDINTINALLFNNQTITDDLRQKTIKLIESELKYLENTNSGDLSDDFSSWFDTRICLLANYLYNRNKLQKLSKSDPYQSTETINNIEKIKKLTKKVIDARLELIRHMAGIIMYYLNCSSFNCVSHGICNDETPQSNIKHAIHNAEHYSKIDVTTINPDDPTTFNINYDDPTDITYTSTIASPITQERLFWEQAYSALEKIDKNRQLLQQKLQQIHGNQHQYRVLIYIDDMTNITTLYNECKNNLLPGVELPSDITNHGTPTCFTDFADDLIANHTELLKRLVIQIEDPSESDESDSEVESSKPKQSPKSNGNFYIQHPSKSKDKKTSKRKDKKVSPSKSESKKTSKIKVKDKKISEFPSFEDAPFESQSFEETPFDEDKQNLNQFICTYTTEDEKEISFKNGEEIFKFALKNLEPIIRGNNLIYCLENSKLNDIGTKHLKFFSYSNLKSLKEQAINVYVRVHPTPEKYQHKNSQKFVYRIYFVDPESKHLIYIFCSQNGRESWIIDPNEGLEEHKKQCLKEDKNKYDIKVIKNWTFLQAHSHFYVPVESNGKIIETMSHLKSLALCGMPATSAKFGLNFEEE